MSANPPTPPVHSELINVPRAGGVTARQTFGGQEVEFRGETAASAVAEQARAQVEARFIMARRFPRDLMVVREKILKDCQRPFFAEKAIYHKPIGKGVEGPSIRFAEAAARAMTNIATDVLTVYDDQYKRILYVSATDLEANVTHPMTVVCEKTVERSSRREGQALVGQRINSSGSVVYIVEATDDECLNKMNALTSKALRTCILRLVPGDITEEAIDRCYQTRRDRAAQDPEGQKKRMCDAFLGINVNAEDLSRYLGKPVADATFEEMDRLRGVYTAIKESETTWAEVIEHALAQRQGAPAAPPAGAAPAPGAKPANLGDVTTRAKSAREASTSPAKPAGGKPGTTPPPAAAAPSTGKPGADPDPMPKWSDEPPEPGSQG